MKNYFKLILCFFISQQIFAQSSTKTYKQSFSGADKRIVIVSGSTNLTIEGTIGTEVLLESDKNSNEFPPEAEGLKIVTVGAVDNTGIGANVEIDGNTMRIKIPKSKYFGNFTLKIPKELNISVQESGNSYGKWLISGMKGEVEAQTSFSTLTIRGVSGPIVARGGYGKIYIVYDQLNQSKPNSIYANGAVDITLPADTKANLKLNAMYAEVFTDFDIKPAQKDSELSITEKKGNGGISNVRSNQPVFVGDTKGEKGEKGEKDFPALAQTVSADVVRQKAWTKAYDNQNSDDCDCTNDGSTVGIINGGGVSLTIRSDHGNIYLRKKK